VSRQDVATHTLVQEGRDEGHDLGNARVPFRRAVECEARPVARHLVPPAHVSTSCFTKVKQLYFCKATHQGPIPGPGAVK